jgi:hypothetical protein
MKSFFTTCLLVLSLGNLRAASPPTNTVSPTDYAAFRIIADRNIFNSRRKAGMTNSIASPRTNAPAARTESFALVGTMRYEKGYFAFFDGSASDYKKVLKPEDTISGFKIKEVRPSAVVLQSATNEMEMKVGTQLSRVDKGEWKVSERAENLEVVAAPASRGNSSRDNRDNRDNKDPRRSTDRPPENNAPNGDGSAILDQILSAVDGAAPAPRTSATNAPGTNTGSPGDILEILRRRREQE